jgi:hypothetical protein
MTDRWARGRAAAAAALLAAAVLALDVGAGAQGADPAWTLSPTTVSDGSTLTASGTGCVDPETGSGDGLQAVVLIPGLSYPSSGNPDGIAYLYADSVAADGTWTATATLDTREEVFGPYEDFTVTATAGCLRGGTEEVFTYDQAYDVAYQGDRPSSTTTTVAPTTTATAPPAPIAPSPAPPAAPVAGAPAFTG